jgi:hypothetical protein
MSVEPTVNPMACAAGYSGRIDSLDSFPQFPNLLVQTDYFTGRVESLTIPFSL